MSGAEDGAAAEPFWSEHLGLVISAALSIFIVVKITAVARWNSTTARGILAANGTTNVLIGSVLTSLPTLYVLMAVWVRPRVQQRLELHQKTAVERSAANLPWTALGFMLALAVPIGVLLVVGLVTIAYRIVVLIILPKVKLGAKEIDRVSRFESDAVTAYVLIWVVFITLPAPWLPTESIQVDGREAQTGYVLARDGQHVVVLMDSQRVLERLDAEAVETELCELDASWFFENLGQSGSKADYPACPRSDP